MNTTPKITKGTIVRTILMGIVILNLILKQTGKPLINIGESEVTQVVQTVIEILVIAVNWWYNNDVTPKARKAKEFLDNLEKSEDSTNG